MGKAREMGSSEARSAEVLVAPGDLIAGKYRVEAQIGKGGMGIVVAAMHVELEQRVAIKILHRSAAENPDFAARFSREARAAAKIKSEHVARVMDVGTLDNGTGYIVMEHLEGSDLADVLRVRGALPVMEAVDYILQACSAVAAAHAAGVVHRDLKPANLFLARQPDRSTTLKVLDFGVSKVTHAEGRVPTAADGAVTHTGEVFGSPMYMSPEQLRATALVDTRADIWALGVVLYELLVNQTPFWRGAFAEILAAVMRDPAPLLGAHLPDAPAGLEAVIARCLEKEPGKRYANIGLLARALLPFGPQSAAGAVDRMERLLNAADVTMDVASQMAPSDPAGQASTRSARPSEPRSQQDSGRRAALPSHGENRSTLSAASHTAGNLDAEPGRRGVRTAAIFGGIAVLAGVVSTLALRGRMRAEPTSAPSVASTVVASAVETSVPIPVEAGRVEVSISVTSVPAGTKVYSGETMIGTLPGSVRLPRGTEEVALRLVAEGYATTEVRVVPDMDRLVAVALDRAPSVARPAPKPAVRPKRSSDLEPF